MNRFLPILIFTFAITASFAQKTDSTKSKTVSGDTLHLPTGKIDSISAKAKHKTDSISSQLQKVQNVKLNVPGAKEAAAVQSATQNVLGAPAHTEQKILSQPAAVEKKLQQKLSRIDAKKEVDRYNQKVRVLQKHFKHHLDSMSKLQVKDPRVTKSMDSLKKKMKHLKEAKSVKDVKKGEQRLAQLQSGLNSKVKGFESKVNKELSALGIKAPNLNVPGLNIPKVNLTGANLPGDNLGLNTNLPNVNVPSVGNTSLPNGNVSLPGVSQAGTPNVPSTSTSLPGNILPGTEMKELSNIEKEAGQVTKATGEISKAEGEIKNLNPDKLESTLEKDAQNIKEVKQFSGEAAQMEQYKKMVAKWESDPEYRKEMAVTKAKEQVINHFAGQEKQLMASMQQLTNVKKKYKDYEGTLDMFKKPGNAMKGKPFIERLRPGVNIQFQAKREVMIDFNPQVVYRITGGISAGLGWNERWGYDFNKWNYISTDHIYGPRGYAHVKIKTNVYAMLAPEVMNAFVPPYYSSPDPGTRKWVWTWMGGVKKEFRYSKSMLGSAQILYNIFDKGNKSPYVSKLNIRMGFEIPLKKK